MRRAISLIGVLCFLSVSQNIAAQSCFNVAAGNDTTISCMQPCLDLKARIPNLRSSDNYSVVSIPYAPLAYTTPGGIESALVYADDFFSDSFNLPFPFCFYGNTYNKLCVGSNGVLSFDVATNANTLEGYVLNPGDKIFFAGGTPNNQNNFYPPKASIFLAYYDMNPASSPAERKIEWRVEGNAPCRRFVVSYYHIGNWDLNNCPNLSNLCTMQAVLYEGSGLIDVFYENKPSCTAYQSGLAIAGLQNFNRDQAVPLPRKNGTAWTARNEGYRYIPNGATSLLNRVELYKNNTLISSGTTVDLGNGELEASFANICQTEDSMSYTVKAFYQKCDNSIVETEGSDTMIVYKTLNPISTTVTNALCKNGNGTITVTSPVAGNIEYSIDGGVSWQSSNSFNKPAGTYTIRARIAGSTCGGTALPVIITEPVLLTATTNTTAATCVGNDGGITITPNGGTPAFSYSIDNGNMYQSSNVFAAAPGNYMAIKIKDANGCIAGTSASVALNDQLFLSVGNDTTICAGQSVTLQPQTNAQTDTFKWTPATGLNVDTIKNPVSTPADTMHYFLNAKWGICNRNDDIWVKVLHKPVANAGKDTTICYKTFALLNGSATNLSGTVNYAWTPAANVTPPNTRIALAKPDTTQNYTLTVTDNYGCNFSVSDDILVTMRPPVPANAGNDTIAVYGLPHQLYGSGGKNYYWTPSTPLNNPFAKNPLAVLTADTRFTVLVTDDIGCTNTDEVFIKVYKGPTYYVPNAFTPNGDGINDIFKPIPVGIAFTQYFAIYNRSGELIFENNQWLRGWDGTYKGKKAAAGTYIWILKGIDRDGKTVEMKGTVILIH